MIFEYFYAVGHVSSVTLFYLGFAGPPPSKSTLDSQETQGSRRGRISSLMQTCCPSHQSLNPWSSTREAKSTSVTFHLSLYIFLFVHLPQILLSPAPHLFLSQANSQNTHTLKFWPLSRGPSDTWPPFISAAALQSTPPPLASYSYMILPAR